MKLSQYGHVVMLAATAMMLIFTGYGFATRIHAIFGQKICTRFREMGYQYDDKASY